MKGRQDAWTTTGMACVTCPMLLWALYGSPPYAFFGVLKWVVALTCIYAAGALWRHNKSLAPIALVLLAVTGIHLFGKMRREEWALFNWAAIGSLALAVALLWLCHTIGFDGRA